jgi:hypothetical protein
MSYMDKIKNYGMDIDYIDSVSPFELIGTLVNRDELAGDYEKLSTEEKILLKQYDKKLLKNATRFYEALKGVYHFQNRKPLGYWWSNIDLVVAGKLNVDLDRTDTYQAYLA